MLYVYSYMSNVVNLYVRFSCMCIYCLYLHRRQNVLITQLFILPVCIYIFILCYTCICHMLSTCMFAYHVCVLYVFVLYLSCMYLSWRHGRTAPWPSCLSRLKNLIKKNKKKTNDINSMKTLLIKDSFGICFGICNRKIFA